ncbi:hypothetical protein GCM10022280_09290 [Sphingomonas swuensis]|uniref:Uncharacterized protein n=1 Tax=Sphingomonas swuensis TaxID=977800 RepID=A0ABP7SLR3_9SPHN
MMTDRVCHWGLSNPGPQPLSVWLEPWADEVEVPARSTITLTVTDGLQDCAVGEVEWSPDHLVVWASAPMIEAHVDGDLQHTGSAIIPAPKDLTKAMLGVAFRDQPSARLAGRPFSPSKRSSWWQRARRVLGL